MSNPTPKQRIFWERIRELGCIVCKQHGYVSIHHIGTGLGGRKDHDKVIPLCYNHHQGAEGIHRGRRAWQAKHGTEQELLEKTLSQIE